MADLQREIELLSARADAAKAQLREAYDELAARHDGLDERLTTFERRVAPPPEDPSEPGDDAGEAYDRVVQDVRAAVKARVPKKSVVAVVTRGDPDLVSFEGRRGWHFPQTAQGVYAGHHPSDSRSAISHLEELRRRGARYLVLPSTAFWWLEHYRGLVDHLGRTAVPVAERDSCVIYRLKRPSRLRRWVAKR